jgi:hypothetical protein
MWPVVSKLLDSPWSTIRTASVALLTLIASCTQRHACCSTLSYRRFQVVMIDSVQRLLYIFADGVAVSLWGGCGWSW